MLRRSMSHTLNWSLPNVIPVKWYLCVVVYQTAVVRWTVVLSGGQSCCQVWTVVLSGGQSCCQVDSSVVRWTVVLSGGQSCCQVDSRVVRWTVVLSGGQSCCQVDSRVVRWTACCQVDSVLSGGQRVVRWTAVLSGDSDGVPTVWCSSSHNNECQVRALVVKCCFMWSVNSSDLSWASVCVLVTRVFERNFMEMFYLQLYGVRHMVKDHSDSEKGNPLPSHTLLFPISSKGSCICAIPQTG